MSLPTAYSPGTGWAAWSRGCIVDQEFEIGMRVLGVPLLDRAGRLKATLTITTDAARLRVDEMRLRYLPRRYEAQALLRPVLD